MKEKYIFVYAAILFMVACSNQETHDSDSLLPIRQQVTNIRSFEEALQIAQFAISTMDDFTKTRTASQKKINLSDSKICKLDAMTRGVSNINDTLMYIFNFENNQGFAIIAAPKNAMPLLAITENGHYDPDVPSEIEGYNLFIESAKEYVKRIQSHKVPARLDPIIIQKDSIVYTHSFVGPYVNVRWGQKNPEGIFCINNLCGCVNTGIAQIMSYYGIPSSIPLTYDLADRPIQYLNWNSIRMHVTGDTITNCLDTMSHNAIGRLCRQLGKLTNSSYHLTYGTKPGSTSTSGNNILPTMSNLGWNTDSWHYYSESYVTNCLDNCHPLLLGGQRVENNDTTGHVWVVDGYDDLLITTYTFDKPVGSLEWILSDISTDSAKLFHFNWGWYGKNNGYFYANVFDTSAVMFPDTFTNTITGNYNLNVVSFLFYPN